MDPGEQEVLTTAPLTAGELDELCAGCGQLTLVGRLDRGAGLGPVLEYLARRPREEGYRALVGAERVYRTRLELGVDDPLENANRSTKLAVLVIQWRRQWPVAVD